MSFIAVEKGCKWGLYLGLVLWVGQEGLRCYAAADDAAIPSVEFSGSLVKTVKGRQYHAQVFAKEDRLRLEYKYAIQTERGYTAIEIIRIDKSETWYLLAQQKELLVTGLNSDDSPPFTGGARSNSDRGCDDGWPYRPTLRSSDGPSWSSRAIFRMGRSGHRSGLKAGQPRSRVGV
jgi:hypothetical protein